MVELNRAHTFASSSSLASSTSSSPPSTPTAHGLRHNSSSSSLAGSAGGLSYEDHLSASSYRARPSRFLKLVNWWHMLSVYFPAILYALIAVLVAQLFVDVSDHGREIKVRPVKGGRENKLLCCVVLAMLSVDLTAENATPPPILSSNPSSLAPSLPPSLPRSSCTWSSPSRPSASPSS